MDKVMKPRLNKKKLRNLVLYCLGARKRRESASETFVWLSNVLYLIDVENYALFGKSITGSTYIRTDFGAMPRQLPKLLKDMLNSGDIALTKKRKKG